MTTNHTPGPWGITGDRDAVEAQCPGAPYKIIIAETIGYKHVRVPNAILIAAAPELLAALEYIMAWSPDGAKWDVETARSMARAAIAKARGDHAD
jgi:hypothetical protein